jgi:pimeloyl-ACP methyl ester carboxylesterase
MVELSDNGDIMNKFLNLPCPKMFMYGEQNSKLSYLDDIKSKGVRLSEISECGHFPMYANPPMMWREISDFLNQCTRSCSETDQELTCLIDVPD